MLAKDNTVQFDIANVGVQLRGISSDVLGGRYHDATHVADCGVELDLTIQKDFPLSRARGPSYPGFETSRAGSTLTLDRFDASGTVSLQDPTRIAGRFVVGTSANSIEAIIRIVVGMRLALDHCLLMHGSSVLFDDQATLFVGPSGIGKSTISTLIDQHSRATKIVDELSILKVNSSGSCQLVIPPFIGEYGAPVAACFPVTRIYKLGWAPSSAKARLEGAEARKAVLKNVLLYGVHPLIAQGALEAADTASPLVWSLSFAPNVNVLATLEMSG